MPGKRLRVAGPATARQSYAPYLWFMHRRRRTFALVFAVAGATTLSGCYLSPPPPIGCVPRITVTPAVAAPGDTITLESDTTCDDAPPDGGWIVTATHVGSTAVLAQTTSNAQFDGSFIARMVLPTDFPIGEAYAGVSNWDYSFCESGGGSCASATGDFIVRP